MELFQMVVVVSTALGLTSGSWSNLNCPAPRAPDNGLSFIFRNGELVHFRCHPGYYMRGKSVVYCVNNQWTGPAPECIAIRGHRQHEPRTHVVQEDNYFQAAHHSPASSTEKDRSLFSWDGQNKDLTHQQNKQGSVYGDGPRRLPLINGIWPPQSQQVMTLGPQSTPGPHALMKEEVDIAELRHKQLEEVKNQRLNVDSSVQLKKRRRNKKGKRKKKKGLVNQENVVDENASRETVISLGSTDEGDALSIAFAKMPNDTKPQKHRYRHDGHRKHPKNKSKKWQNADQYSTHIVSRASRVDNSGIPPYSHRYSRHRYASTDLKTSNEVAEVRGRPTEQVDEHNKTDYPKGSIYPVSEFDTSCLESLYGHDVPMIAPHVASAFVYRYETRKNRDFPFNSYLQVKYRCLSGFVFVNHHIQTLNCRQGAWVGEVPRCEARKKQ